ncbi:MAG: septum formation protein Maf [Bdellovibrionales bacterium CG10_big_fil_rev_8_21_14_0_10_45_34]|nr:MAG: septum formation protein Maf [Bdellovibrionales bacterium CG10_big_fil_rev_8_21_14_0_10_45_34]
MRLILASTSKYRAVQLRDAGYEFVAVSPEADEKTIAEDPSYLLTAQWRARLKALSVAVKYPDDIIVGSDQLVHFNSRILGKPGTRERAIEQLTSLSSKTHQLATALTLVYRGDLFELVVVAHMKMKSLTPDEIAQYIDRDNPIDCAGAYKFEEQGSKLFESVECEDMSSIQGLPLNGLSTLLTLIKDKFGL